MPQQPSNDTNQGLTSERREVQRIAALLRKAPPGLKDYHAIGEQMRRLAEDPSVARRGSNWREKVAGLVGCSPSTLTKALQFRLAYGGEDLPELEQLGVGWSRLTIALGVQDREQRHQLLHRAKEEGWGERELQRALQQLKGRRRGGGRPRREAVSHGCLPDLVELLRLTEQWLSYHAGLWGPSQARYVGELKRLPEEGRESLRRLLEDAAAELKALRRQCGEALDVVKALRGKLGPG